MSAKRVYLNLFEPQNIRFLARIIKTNKIFPFLGFRRGFQDVVSISSGSLCSISSVLNVDYTKDSKVSYFSGAISTIIGVHDASASSRISEVPESCDCLPESLSSSNKSSFFRASDCFSFKFTNKKITRMQFLPSLRFSAFKI